RDRRDERLWQRRSDRVEQAPNRGLGNMQSMPRPFDPIGKKFRAYEDYREAERQDYRVYCQNSAPKGRSSVENRDAPSRFPARTHFPGPRFESGEKIGGDAAKRANDAYNIIRRARIRDKAGTAA